MTETFAALWKGMNTNPIPDGSPLINAPKNASADLIRQANKKIGKGQDRKKVLGQLQASTRRAPAAVIAPPSTPNPSSPTTQTGFGGSGYSGRNASVLGQFSNTGFSEALPPQPVMAKGFFGTVGRLANNGLAGAEQFAERKGASLYGRLAQSKTAEPQLNASVKRATQIGRRGVLKDAGIKAPRSNINVGKSHQYPAHVNAAFDVADVASKAEGTSAHHAAFVARGRKVGPAVLRAGLLGGAALGASTAYNAATASPPTPPTGQFIRGR